MEDVWGNQIAFADQDKVSFYDIEMKRVLAAVAFFLSDDPQKFLNSVWVSDMSSVGDFNLEYEDVVKIAESLDVPVAENELLWKVAKSIREKESVK